MFGDFRMFRTWDFGVYSMIFLFSRGVTIYDSVFAAYLAMDCSITMGTKDITKQKSKHVFSCTTQLQIRKYIGLTYLFNLH